MKQHRILHWLSRKISTKIILPYFLLTLVTASIGAYVITNLVTGSLHERFINQLLDAGRVTAESMVDTEKDRLQVLRAVTNTTGVAEAVVNADRDTLATLVPP